MHLIDKENIVTYVDFDCGFTFYSETATKTKQINRDWNYTSRSCEKPKFIASNDQHNCFIDAQYNFNIIMNPLNLWDMGPATLMSLNHTNDRYSMSNQYPQPTTHQPRTDSHPVFSSLRRMDSKRLELRVSFAFFHRSYRSDGRANGTNATVEDLSDLWKPGAMDGISPLVMNCICFQV